MNRLICVVSMCAFLFVVTGCSVPEQQEAVKIGFDPVPSDTVKVMTYNVKVRSPLNPFKWNSRKGDVFKLIADNEPDVFCLQEPDYSQLVDFQQAFGQYGSYFAGSRDGKTKGQSCPIFYRKDRFELVDSGTFWFSDRPDKPGSQGWGNIIPRFCSWVILTEKNQNNSFVVFNTHMAWLSQRSRSKSVRLLEEKASAWNKYLPSIVLGDFNMTRDNSAIKFLLTPSTENPFPLTDAWQSVHPGSPDMPTCNFGTFAKGPQIDHIKLCQKAQAIAVKIDDRKIDGRYPSDHFPVIATIKLKPTG